MNGILIVLVCTVAFFVILYQVIRAAVRAGIIDAQSHNPGVKPSGISQAVCVRCGKSHDVDYPKCPHCGEA